MTKRMTRTKKLLVCQQGRATGQFQSAMWPNFAAFHWLCVAHSCRKRAKKPAKEKEAEGRSEAEHASESDEELQIVGAPK